MPLDSCLNFHNPTAGSWDSPSCPLIGQYWPLLWRHRSSKYAQLATPMPLLWYLGLFNSFLLGRFVLRDKQLATVNQHSLTLFDLPVTSKIKKNKVNIIASCGVRRDLSNAVWIFTLRLLLLKIRRGPFGPPSGRVTRQTPSARGLITQCVMPTNLLHQHNKRWGVRCLKLFEMMYQTTWVLFMAPAVREVRLVG